MAAVTEEKLSNVDKLCRQSIQKYLDIKGIPYEKQGYYLRLTDHDSLVVDTRITSQKPYETFYWNSQGVGGNLYNFLRSYEGLEKKLALDQLEKLAPELAKAPQHHYRAVEYQPEKWPGSRQSQQMINYFTKIRKLDERLIQVLIKHGLIRQLRNGSAFFSWRDKNMKEIGGDVQGTVVDHKKFGKRGTVKMIAKGSAREFGFRFNANSKNDDTKKLYVFESPIDMLSYFQMHGNQPGAKTFLSLNGAATKVNTVSNYITKFGVPDEIHLALDTDTAGLKGIIRINGKLETLRKEHGWDSMKIIVDQPNSNNKDWNDALKLNDKQYYAESMHDFANRKTKELGAKRIRQIMDEMLAGNMGNSKAITDKINPQKASFKQHFEDKRKER
ncbi:toprim domain-containing protein [Limosilactobacillus reuteri]|uniref:toprim domain-containing protein n=1 Tax=Limosilactobacillus reuteri TaxID=1598 RepID=UPI003D785B28